MKLPVLPPRQLESQRPVVVARQPVAEPEPDPTRGASAALAAIAPLAIFMVALVAAATAATGLGYWWVTPLAGLVIGAILPWGRPALVLAAVTGLAAWGLPLLWLAAHEPVARTAAVVGTIMGIAGLGAFGPTIITLVVGMLLCVSGAWVGMATRGMIDPYLRGTKDG